MHALVAGEGLEPSILAAADFKSAVYTNSTTQPQCKILLGYQKECECPKAAHTQEEPNVCDKREIVYLFEKFTHCLFLHQSKATEPIKIAAESAAIFKTKSNIFASWSILTNRLIFYKLNFLHHLHPNTLQIFRSPMPQTIAVWKRMLKL